MESLQRQSEDIYNKKNVKCKCWWVIANVFKRLVSNASEGKYKDTDRLSLSAETSVRTHTHLACRWRRGSAGGDSGWLRLIHRSSAGGRRSGPYLPPRLSHSPPAPPDNGLRERKTDVNIVIQRADDGEEEKEGEKRKGTNRRNRCGEKEMLSLHLTWDRTFQNKVLKESFIYLLFIIWTQHGGNGEGEGKRGGDRVIKIKRLRVREKTLKDSTSKRGSLWTICSYDYNRDDYNCRHSSFYVHKHTRTNSPIASG